MRIVKEGMYTDRGCDDRQCSNMCKMKVWWKNGRKVQNKGLMIDNVGHIHRMEV